MKSPWKFFTSLRLTVTLLALSVLLVFFGTLSQVDEGLWKAQKIWFESYIVTWQHLQLFGLKFLVPIFPGGYLIGFTLLVGLIAAFIKRFAWRKDKIGIHLTHGGVILLLLGQLLAQELAVESYIEFKEGETKTYAEDHVRNELAFIHDAGGEEEESIVIPEPMLKPGAGIKSEKLPFTVRVKDYGVNCQILRRKLGIHGPGIATQGTGAQLVVEPRVEVTDMDSRNLPYAYIELLQGGQSLGTWLVTPWLALVGAGSQEFAVGEQKFRMELRFKRYYKPFSITLLKTSNETYRGTDIPKNFRSRVRIIDAVTREARTVDIYMNHPLRYAGLTFYQARMGRDTEDLNRGTSALQVVRNPGWSTPYVAILIVAAGMYIQFRQHLTKFLNKRLGRDLTARKGRWGGIAGRLLEAGALGYLVLRFALKLFGYAS
jgi:hypothetical protein